MNNLVAFARALADATRWRIVQLVADEPMCVCEMADILAMPQSSVSSHIQIICKAGLLDSERCGKWVYYRVAASKHAVLATLTEHFREALEADATLTNDARRSVKRLAEREASCCPAPKTLSYAPQLILHKQNIKKHAAPRT